MTISGCLSNRLDRDEVRHFVGPDLCSTVCKSSQHETLCRQKLNYGPTLLKVLSISSINFKSRGRNTCFVGFCIKCSYVSCSLPERML